MKIVQSYGLDLSKLPRDIHQLDVELLYVGHSDPESYGGLSRDEHMRNCIKMLYPWVWENWHEWNELCLWAWVNYKEIGMTGCAAAHKTFTFSLLPFIQWLADPMQSTLFLTSTTLGSLRGRIWSEVKRFYNQATIPFGFNIVDSKTMIQSKQGEDKFAIRAIAVDSGQVEQAVGKIQGVHPRQMMLIVDEAAQTPAAIYTARANLQVNTDLYRFVAIANASDQYDSHGKFCEPKGGWSTVTANDEHWETKTGVCVHFDGEKSPNVIRRKKIFPRLFSLEDLNSIINDYGKNSLEYWSYARGFWAPKGVRNTVLDAAIISENKAAEEAVWAGTTSPPIEWASLDPAFTTGGDEVILRFAKIGEFLDGKQGLEFTDVVKIQLEESKDNPLSYQIVNKVMEECKKRGVRPENFILDSTSAASTLADLFSQLWGPEISRVSFGGAVEDGPVSMDDDREAKKVYDRFVTQLWFNVQRLVCAGRIRGLDTETAREFCTRQYGLKGEKTYIETKAEMKERTGGDSPDRADAAALLCLLFMRRFSGFNSLHRDVKEIEWGEMIKKFKTKANYAEI